MKKTLKIFLILTMVLSLLCTPIFADNGNIGVNDPKVLSEDTYVDEFDVLIDGIEGIEKEDKEQLEKLFNEISELEEKLDDKFVKFSSILGKYIDEDELADLFGDEESACGQSEAEEQEGTLVMSYSIKDGKITVNEKPEVESDEHIKIQNNTDAHEEIWKLIKDIVPAKYLKRLTHFEINTDGKEGILAHVVPTDEVDNSKWIISVDIADVLKSDGKLNKKELAETIIHEFAHVLTLNNEEIDFREPSENENTYVTQEGVTKEKSYLNQFYQKFWADIFDEWVKKEEIEDEEEYWEATDKFYEKYKSRFVSDYAATNPGEDIAETFRIFVTDKKPQGKTIAEKKVLFLYSFPELVKMRQEIRKAL